MQEGCNKGKQHAELHIFVAAPQKALAGPAPALAGVMAAAASSVLSKPPA